MHQIAVRAQWENSENSIQLRFSNEIPHNIGQCVDVCAKCDALHWIAERTRNTRTMGPSTYSTCCQGGKVLLPEHYFDFPPVPPFLQNLFTGKDNCTHFASNCPRASKELTVLNSKGALYHDMGLILPRPGTRASFAQIYVMGTQLEDEASHRKLMSRSKEVDVGIIAEIQDFMYEHNPYAQQFRMAHDILGTAGSISLKLKSVTPTEVGSEGHDIRTYCRPTVNKVAMIVAGGGVVGEKDRDLILHSVDGQWECVSEQHTGYLPLRYPLLFPYGQAGYDEFCRVPTPNRVRH
ncbi:uncharacterized protein MELLADRAFT_69712 [Melampsora larici-populina 98AG31]|uniref:Uncharacterized protein n=1 Tax=Melampsora larici-populina (strain 98AG31 / pathotype 3-4-7) TaxID=747676 RepID=F4SBV7_MELLP|nr:uncharacterized protein MELLADRAFT_69712 [Melampsora larici-populina 98AG31]EGF97876.1 hypothetical protein MELLADRAFT_69712 [Melampsora larici-populina 98AG31]